LSKKYRFICLNYIKTETFFENRLLLSSARYRFPSATAARENVVQIGCENCGAFDAASLFVRTIAKNSISVDQNLTIVTLIIVLGCNAHLFVGYQLPVKIAVDEAHDKYRRQPAPTGEKDIQSTVYMNDFDNYFYFSCHREFNHLTVILVLFL